MLSGMRWECTRCCDYDLCSICYMAGKHNIEHEFFRYDKHGALRFEASRIDYILSLLLLLYTIGTLYQHVLVPRESRPKGSSPEQKWSEELTGNTEMTMVHTVWYTLSLSNVATCTKTLSVTTYACTCTGGNGKPGMVIILKNWKAGSYVSEYSCILNRREACMQLQLNLHNTDTIGTLPNCPYYRGVLSSEVDIVQQATPLNQRGSPRLTKKGLKEV